MKVMVIFRGGVGDFFCWTTKFQSLLLFHEGAEVELGIVSPWPAGIQAWARRLLPRQFPRIFDLGPYSRPASKTATDFAVVGHDLVYHCDVWQGKRGEQARRCKMRPVASFFPWLVGDPYPRLDIESDSVGGTIIQVEGKSVKEPFEPLWWKRLTRRNIPRPVRIVGLPSKGPSAYGAREVITTPEAIYAAIKGAELFVGLDSGFRNIALTCKVPVVEVETPSRGYPDYDVFVPRVYRDAWTLIPEPKTGDPQWLAVLHAAGRLLVSKKKEEDNFYPIF